MHDRIAVCLHFGFFLLRGCGEILLTARSDIHEQKRLISIINRFVRSGGSWSRGARYSEGAGARCDAPVDLRVEATPKTPLKGSFGQPVRDTLLGSAEKYRMGVFGPQDILRPNTLIEPSLAMCP